MEDLDRDDIILSIEWGNAGAFMSLENNRITINDIREDSTNPLKPGQYPIFLTLSD